jgi:hypothetical protein
MLTLLLSAPRAETDWFNVPSARRHGHGRLDPPGASKAGHVRALHNRRRGLLSVVILATDRLLRGTGAGWPRSDRIEGSGSRQPQARVGQQRARSLLICVWNRDACCVCFGVTVRLVGHSGRGDKAKEAAVRRATIYGCSIAHCTARLARSAAVPLCTARSARSSLDGTLPYWC